MLYEVITPAAAVFFEYSFTHLTRQVLIDDGLDVPLELLQGQRDSGIAVIQCLEQAHLGQMIARVLMKFTKEHHVIGRQVIRNNFV